MAYKDPQKQREANLASYYRNKEKRLEYCRKYAIKNKEKIAEYHRKRHQENYITSPVSEEKREYNHLRYLQNRKKALLQAQIYQIQNRETITKRRKKYRKTESGKAATIRAFHKYIAKNPKRQKAWQIAAQVHKELKLCVECGELPTHRHHPDIDKPAEIIFLCPLHHTAAHRV